MEMKISAEAKKELEVLDKLSEAWNENYNKFFDEAMKIDKTLSPSKVMIVMCSAMYKDLGAYIHQSGEVEDDVVEMSDLINEEYVLKRGGDIALDILQKIAVDTSELLEDDEFPTIILTQAMLGVMTVLSTVFNRTIEKPNTPNTNLN